MTEYQIALWAVGVILAANVLAMGLFVLFARLPDGKLKESIRGIIFELDKLADNMENSQKRATAMQEIGALLGWRKILVPTALIGWVIDMEVAAIRKMQAATAAPNLHEGDGK